MVAAVGLQGISCATPSPLRLRHYCQNVVIGSDRILRVNTTPVDLGNLRSTLVLRGANEESPIVVHVHESISTKTFDLVVGRLNAEGFRNLSFEIFRGDVKE